MKVLVMYDYPPPPGGLATQADNLYQGLRNLGIDAHAVNYESSSEKEWYYRWFAPDIAVGVGYWGYTPDLVLHPQQFGVTAIPWLVADGYIGNFRDTLNNLPLILLTSNWVREVYIRDGIHPEHLEVLPVGCDTDAFVPRSPDDPQVAAVRKMLGVAPDELMLLTVGGDAASKGAREVMEALASITTDLPPWKYVCKVWPQERTSTQNRFDLELACQLGIDKQVIFTSGIVSRNFMPYLLAACDIYVGPSRLEGFGMPHVEAGACGKPVIAIDAMAFRDTLVHGQTALLAGVAQVNHTTEAILKENAIENAGQRVVFDTPRVADYRASVPDLAVHLRCLMQDAALRHRMGMAGRQRVVTHFDNRVVTKQFLEIVDRRLHGQLHLPSAAVPHVNSTVVFRNERYDRMVMPQVVYPHTSEGQR
jgi:glycosyltransferase involved in cell wall biosynthesis